MPTRARQGRPRRTGDTILGTRGRTCERDGEVGKGKRRFWVVLGVAAVAAAVYLSSSRENDAPAGDKQWRVDGQVVVDSPPPGVQLPAVACIWANAHKVPTPGAIKSRGMYTGDAHVVCRVPKHGVQIPFQVTEFSSTGHGLLIGAFLRAIPGGHPACAETGSVVAVVDDTDRKLDALCAIGRVPPKQEVALLTPFDDDKGRPTKAMQVRVLRME
jgi:hypothetical protein